MVLFGCHAVSNSGMVVLMKFLDTVAFSLKWEGENDDHQKTIHYSRGFVLMTVHTLPVHTQRWLWPCVQHQPLPDAPKNKKIRPKHAGVLAAHKYVEYARGLDTCNGDRHRTWCSNTVHRISATVRLRKTQDPSCPPRFYLANYSPRRALHMPSACCYWFSSISVAQ